MTARPLPVTIDVLKLVDRGQELAGSLALRRMPRLCEALVDDAGEAHLVLVFERDQARRATVTGSVRASVALACQRCLQPMPLTLEARVALAVCLSEEEAAALPDDYDPLLLEETPQRLAELVEDELILALPALARHEDTPDCEPVSVTIGASAVEQGGEGRRPNPFAVLDVLKKRDEN
ncbi:MAG: DUF177 domain-containing protein [Ectothiorhodospiraceae bacterium]|nr:DUF177 domain-containing protein [Ectothiorhodospiraceae bacterium]